VIDKRSNRARRMSGVGGCGDRVVVAGGGGWLTSGVRLDQRPAPPVFLERGFPDAAVGDGGDLYLAIDRRIVRAGTSGYEVLAAVPADALAIGGSYLYFHDTEAARIGRLELRTRKVETVVASLPSVAVMAADSHGVYWWAGNGSPIEAAGAPGARRTVLAGTAKLDGLATNGGRLAVLVDKHLIVVAADGTARAVALGNAGRGVACDDAHVYWTEDADAPVLQRDTWSGGDLHVISRVAPR
jgi:hypothetical protein